MTEDNGQKPRWKEEYGDMLAGFFLVFGEMLRECGVPLRSAVKGLKAAYRMAEEKERR